MQGGRGRHRELEKRLDAPIELLGRHAATQDRDSRRSGLIEEVLRDLLTLRDEHGRHVEGEERSQATPSVGLRQGREVGHFRLAEDPHAASWHTYDVASKRQARRCDIGIRRGTLERRGFGEDLESQGLLLGFQDVPDRNAFRSQWDLTSRARA